MALVSYSDSEGSDTEKEAKDPLRKQPFGADPANSTQRGPTATAKSAFPSFVDRTNPRKIKVSLPELKDNGSNDIVEEGRATKRAKIGGSGGAFSGFNALLPAPKKSQPVAAGQVGDGQKRQPPKAFSLKTGAAPGFERGADSGFNATNEREDLDGANTESGGDANGKEKKPEAALQGNRLMFKPLSVARKPQKKKTVLAVGPDKSSEKAFEGKQITTVPPEAKPPPKVSLFSLGGQDDVSAATATADADYEPIVSRTIPSTHQTKEEGEQQEFSGNYRAEGANGVGESYPPAGHSSLDDVASDLNLSAAQRRQLFGRSGKGGTAVNVVNFNTDAEYAANEAFRASGEQVQHNPVRSIVPGKHNLRQLVNAANNQKEALEESFASGRRNKKEAGSKYGW